MTRFVGTPLRGIEFNSVSDEAISARVNGDAHPRIRIDAGGRITWSSGSESGDVNLYRYDINALKTDDGLIAAGGVTTITTSGIPTQPLPDGTIAVDSTNDVFYFRSGGEWLEISSGANVVISETAPASAESGDLWFNSLSQVLYILDGEDWVSVSGSLTLSELDDVLISDLEIGHVLKFDGTKWVNDIQNGLYNAHTEIVGDGVLKDIVVTHNFDTRDIVVQCRNAFSPYESIEVGWEATSPNEVTLRFSSVPAVNSVRANIYATIGAQGTNAYSQTVGDNTSVSFVLNHNFNTRDVIVFARNINSPYEAVEINWQATSLDSVTAIFSVPPPSGGVRVTVYAGGGVSGVTSISGTANEITVSGNTGTVEVGIAESVFLSGSPSASTAVYGTNSQQLATTAFVQEAVGAFASDLDGLSDVVITDATTGQVLKFNGTNWVNDTDNAGTTINSIDDIGDVTAPTPSSGDFLKWNGTKWVNDAIDLGTDTTGNYVSDVVAGTGVTVTHAPGEGSSPTIAIGQNVSASSSPTFAGVTADNVQVGITGTNEIDTISGNLTIDSAGGTVTVDDDLVVSGNLTVNGTTTTLNTENLDIEDNIIKLNSNVTGSPVLNAGIEVERGTSDNVLVRWNETNDKWEATNDGSVYGNIITSADTGTVTSTMISDGTIVNADINASAAVALSKLASGTSGQVIVANTSGVPTYTTISGDITISDTGVASIAANSVVLGTDTTGNYVAGVTAGTGITVTHTPGEGSSPTVAIGQPVGTSASVTFASVSSPLITTTGGSSGTLFISPNDISGSGAQTAPYVSVAGADASGTTTVTGGPVLIYGGQASGGSNNTGGNVSIDGGYGSTASGTVSVGEIYANSVTIGRPGRQTTVGGNLVVSGDFTVNGTTTTLNTETLAVEDNIVVLNSGVVGSPVLDAGIEIERGTSTNVAIKWNETTDKWQFTNNGTTYSDLGSGGATISDTPPSSPESGQLWFESDTGRMFVYYDSYWIEVVGGQGPTGPQGPTGAAGADAAGFNSFLLMGA